MTTEKVFIGSQLRVLRQDRGLNQTEFARVLGVSASLVNLLERNQRSASLSILMRLSELFGVELRELTESKAQISLQDLRKILASTVVNQPDIHIDELRNAIEVAPRVIEGLKFLYESHELLAQKILEQSALLGANGNRVQASEQSVHEFMHKHKNHFPLLENIAEDLVRSINLSNATAFEQLSRALWDDEGVTVEVKPLEELYPSVRVFEPSSKVLALSDTLDHTNRVFQLAHFYALIHHEYEIKQCMMGAAFAGHQGSTRAKTMLCDYFAAAILMPYDTFLAAAKKWRYDFERLASFFSVSFEQVCQRVTTLNRKGNEGVPFFFLRVDKAGNISKRFNSGSIKLARYGGTCPRLNVHYSFRVPGRILTQRVEMPDGEQLITINRTVSRPASGFNQDDRRQAICVGCAIRHGSEIVYSQGSIFNDTQEPTQIGLNCQLCPRRGCDQRAHESIVQELPVAEFRRGQNRFDN